MLLDSNIIIYATQPEHSELRRFIAENDIVVSAVSYVEVLGYHKLTAADRVSLSEFFRDTQILSLTHAVLDRAVQLRQARKMSLGDACRGDGARIRSNVGDAQRERLHLDQRPDTAQSVSELTGRRSEPRR